MSAMSTVMTKDWLYSSNYKIARLPRSVVEAQQAQQPLLDDFIVTNTGYFTRVHGHHTRRDQFDEFIVIYCLDGQGWYTANDQTWPVCKGQVLYVMPDMGHVYRSDDHDPWSIQWAHFRGRRAAGYVELADVARDAPVCTIGSQPSISALFTETLDALQSGYSTHHLVKASAHVQQILSQIAMVTTYSPAPGAVGVNVEEIINYMLENLTDRCSLDDFAERACMSRSHFSRQFRDKTGYAPVDYYIRLKIQRACELLETTSLPVRAISLRLGYQDPYYFSRIFKKIVGTHPTEYRQLRELPR